MFNFASSLQTNVSLSDLTEPATTSGTTSTTTASTTVATATTATTGATSTEGTKTTPHETTITSSTVTPTTTSKPDQIPKFVLTDNDVACLIVQANFQLFVNYFDVSLSCF